MPPCPTSSGPHGTVVDPFKKSVKVPVKFKQVFSDEFLFSVVCPSLRSSCALTGTQLPVILCLRRIAEDTEL